ncbi:hypothetical protein [Streptomyces sp. NPDC047070]|uniref:hypothetical protein n=1 Tax=Streptomyces sp. NPDC047070 TaxID=3154923 RepID=UPI003456953F
MTISDTQTVTEALAEPPLALIPTGDVRPVEKAIAESITGQFEPETWLAITFPRPDGGVRVRWAWTAGGVDLGNRIDGLALAAGLDAVDNFHICDLHCRESWRGRIRIGAHPLRPVLADVQAGVRGPEERRAKLRRVIELAAAERGQTARPGVPRWIGVGPDLLNRKGA